MGYLLRKAVLMSLISKARLDMKQLVWMGLLAGLITTGCTNSSVLNREKTDKLGKKFDSAAEKLWDSTKEKGREVGKDLKERIDSLKMK